MQLESRAVWHECERQAPSHDIEEDEIRAVLVDGAALVENPIC